MLKLTLSGTVRFCVQLYETLQFLLNDFFKWGQVHCARTLRASVCICQSPPDVGRNRNGKLKWKDRTYAWDGEAELGFLLLGIYIHGKKFGARKLSFPHVYVDTATHITGTSSQCSETPLSWAVFDLNNSDLQWTTEFPSFFWLPVVTQPHLQHVSMPPTTCNIYFIKTFALA